MANGERRPDPEALLALANREEAAARGGRGRLKVYFGMAPGVGKTYAMLEEAQTLRAEGLDVAVGIVETHGRGETEALLTGLEVLPRRAGEHRGVRLEEFDLDAALARRPAVLLVDELAHSNVPGSRHPKRWQDVDELLAAGLDVHTTMNVQHLESLNDVVASITGMHVRETVPDSILEAADSIVLVDLPPDELAKRLAEGKVYLPAQAERAARNFFRQSNLLALRELALRFMAERIGAQVLVHRQGRAEKTTWATSERLLVCIGPSPSSARVIRAAKRLATGLHAPWYAVYVDTGRHLGEADRQRVVEHLRQAEELGAEAVTLTGSDVALLVTDFARDRNATRIIIGKPAWPRWKSLLYGSPVDELIRLSGDIDVQVVTGMDGPAPRTSSGPTPGAPASLRGHAAACLLVAVCTLAGLAMRGRIADTNLVMLYLLAVVGAATGFGYGPAVLASVLGVLTFDFFFVPPYLTFAVSDLQYVIVFGVMLLTGLVIARLTALHRRQLLVARRLERESAALGEFNRSMAAARGAETLCDIAIRHLDEYFHARATVLMPGAHGQLLACGGDGRALENPKVASIAQWVLDNGQPAGHGTHTLAASDHLFLPLAGQHGMLGVLALRPAEHAGWEELRMPERERTLTAMAKQIALVLEVDRLEASRRESVMAVEAERLKASLLSIATHDFQTPLAAIRGSAESLQALGRAAPPETTAELVENIRQQAVRLSRLIADLLRIVRLTSGGQPVAKTPIPMAEVLEDVLQRLEPQLRERKVVIHLPADLPLVPMDPALAGQLLANLTENATRHTPAGTPIEISARRSQDRLELEVADEGPGIPREDLERIFGMFSKGAGSAGYGLGLAICKAIAEAHGGGIVAENREGGGARFRVTLPLE